MEAIQQVLNWLAQSDSVGKWLIIIMPIVTSVCSLITALSKTPDPKTTWGKIYKIILEIPALNVGKAKDK